MADVLGAVQVVADELGAVQVVQLLLGLKELPEMNTSKGVCLAFTVVLYYMSSVLFKMLMLQQPHIKSLLLIINSLLGSIVSVQALWLISPASAWIALALWLFIYALVGYYNRQELYQELHRLIPERIQNLMEGHGGGMQDP